MFVFTVGTSGLRNIFLR